MVDALGSGSKLINHDLSKRGSSTSAPNLKPIIETSLWAPPWPTPGCLLDIDFINNRIYMFGYGQRKMTDMVSISRSSSATYVNSEGLLSTAILNEPRFDWFDAKQIVRNYYPHSEDFSNSYWSKQAVTVTTNAGTAPDGTNTANLITETASNAEHRVFRTGMIFTTPAPDNRRYADMSMSIYAKANGRNHLVFILQDDGQTARVSFDITTGQYTINVGFSSGGALLGTTHESLGNGWYRIGVIWRPSTNTWNGINAYFQLGNTLGNGGAYLGDGTSGLYLWGAQLEKNTSVSQYFPKKLTYVATCPLRARTSCNGLLREGSNTNHLRWCRDATNTYTRPTNFFAYSQIFTNSAWNFDTNQSQITRTTNFSDPIGGTAATKIVAASGRNSTNAYIGQRSGAGNLSTHSVYMKAAEYSYGVLAAFTFTAGYFAVFDLSLGTITTQPTISGLTASIENVGNGWYRCSITISNLNVSRGFFVTASPDGTTSTTMSGTSGIYIWGAQSENGNSTTAYIETTTISSTVWVLDNVTTLKNQIGIDGTTDSATSLTATANNGTCVQRVVLGNNNVTSSVFLKRISGNGAIQVSANEDYWATIELSDTEWTRVILNVDAVNPSVGIKISSNGDSIAMDYGQIEVNNLTGVVTSPIYTTTSTATRSTDIVTLSGDFFSTWWREKSKDDVRGFSIICEAMWYNIGGFYTRSNADLMFNSWSNSKLTIDYRTSPNNILLDIYPDGAGSGQTRRKSLDRVYPDVGLVRRTGCSVLINGENNVGSGGSDYFFNGMRYTGLERSINAPISADRVSFSSYALGGMTDEIMRRFIFLPKVLNKDLLESQTKPT